MGRPELKQLIFVSKRSGRAYTTQAINYHLRRHKEKYELPIGHFSSHSLRKTFRKKVYEDHGKAEYGLMIVNRTFRHRALQTTERYIGVPNNNMEGVYDSFQFK